MLRCVFLSALAPTSFCTSCAISTSPHQFPMPAPSTIDPALQFWNLATSGRHAPNPIMGWINIGGLFERHSARNHIHDIGVGVRCIICLGIDLRVLDTFLNKFVKTRTKNDNYWATTDCIYRLYRNSSLETCFFRFWSNSVINSEPSWLEG